MISANSVASTADLPREWTEKIEVAMPGWREKIRYRCLKWKDIKLR